MKTTTEQTKEPITNVSETVEEAAKETFDQLKTRIVNNAFYVDGDPNKDFKRSTIGADDWADGLDLGLKTGANWQKQQSDKEIEKIHDESDRQVCVSFKKGWDSCKQQSDTIIKELVEALKMAKNVCTATYPLFNEWIESSAIDSALSKANEYLNK